MNSTNFERGNLTQNGDDFAGRNSTGVFGGYGDVRSEVPQWVVVTYFVIVGIGNCVNFGVIIGLLRCRRKGLLLLILQLSIVDFASTFVAVSEVMSLRKDSWIFSPDLCPLFSGSEVLINSLTIYLIICLNFHVISVWNLQFYRQTDKTRRNPSTSCDEDESNECLVKLNESPSSSRNLTIDYRRRSKDVSVVFPSLLVWFTCLSLSVPEYTLSSTIKIKNLSYNSTVCTIVDTYYGQLLQNLLLAFRAAIPMPLIILSFLVMLMKYHQRKYGGASLSEENKNLANAKSLVLFCIALSALYFVASFPRNILYIMHVATLKITGDNLESFKTPPLYNVYVTAYVNSFVAMLHYSGAFFRIFVYFFCPPIFKKVFHGKIFACAKRD